ncbi:MAG: tRNA pseudouridine(55) synthase TruB [Proteobacteria bacterium]|nr:MAG: tRNA pseudouridine(55) synthase TruB [Pseudomonadota bacterium]
MNQKPQAIKKHSLNDGMIVVYKPRGMSSKDVSRWFERRFTRIKMGHVGTLDPMAEGVLPVLFGKATRIQDFLLAGTKCYEFDVKFGTATDTLDLDGEVIAEAPVGDFTKDDIDKVCAEMEGSFTQIPPLYSAIKYQGKPLYEYARSGRGDEVPRDLLRKQVQIDRMVCLKYEDGIATLRVNCSKGTYVRVLSHHVAETLGTIGVVIRLLRVATGDLDVGTAVSLDTLEQEQEAVAKYIIPLENIRLDIPSWHAEDPALIQRLKMGQEMHVEMKSFETGLTQSDNKRSSIKSLDHMILIDKSGQSFGIGSALVLNTGRVAVRMRRGLS